jgi:hypothetical protein
MCIHGLGHLFPLLLTLPPASLPGRTCSALFFNFVEDLSDNKKDIAFLLA